MGYWEGDTYIPSDYEKAQQQQQGNDLSNALSGPGSKLTLSGSPEQQSGALQGLQFGQMLYGQGIADVGQQSKQYSDMVQGRLRADYAKADIYRQAAGERIGQANVKAGLGGVDTAGTTEQASRQAAMDAAGMNQDYRDKALALYGRNISAKQQGLAGQYMAGAGIGQAATPAPVTVASTGTLPCFALVLVGAMSKETYASESLFVNKNSLEYLGYATISAPIVYMIFKSDLFAKVYSYFAHKYIGELTGKNKSLVGKLIIKIGTPICKMVGKLC